MKFFTCALITGFLFLISQHCLAFDHLTCKQFTLMAEKEKVLATRTLIGGLGAALGLVESSVRSIKKSYDKPDVVLGADLVQTNITHFVTIPSDTSGEKLSKQLGLLCLREGSQEKPVASALLDILMGITK